MKITKQIIVFDAADLDAESSFWATVLDGEVDAEDDWHSLKVDGQWTMGFQLAPENQPPTWPGGDVPQQIHLDLYVDDVPAADRKVLDAGAIMLQDADRTAASGFIVYADPAGHPFCICWGNT